MKAGDLVRYWIPGEVFEYGAIGDYKTGLLLEHHTWEKIAIILTNDGQTVRISSRHVEKAGKKDQNLIDNRAKLAQNRV